jgi:hypothetical protein
MSELPLDEAGAARDPEEILHRLPETERARFLDEYHSALEAAHEVWRYRQLQEVLHTWSLVAAAHSQPGYETRKAEAKTPPTGRFRSAEDVIPDWATRLGETR